MSKHQTRELREYVTLESSTESADSYGQAVPIWKPTANMPASVKPIKAEEGIRAGQVDSLVTHTVLTRFRQDLTTAKRFKFGSQILNITKAVDPDNRNQWIECECIEDTDG